MIHELFLVPLVLIVGIAGAFFLRAIIWVIERQGATTDSGGSEAAGNTASAGGAKATPVLKAPQSASTPATHDAASVAGAVELAEWLRWRAATLQALGLQRELHEKLIEAAAELERLDKRKRRFEAALDHIAVMPRTAWDTARTQAELLNDMQETARRALGGDTREEGGA